MGSYIANCPICKAKNSINYQPKAKILKCRKCGETFDLEKSKPTMTIDEYLKLRKEAVFLTATNGYMSSGRGAVILDVQEWPPTVKRFYFSDKIAQATIGWPDKEIETLVKTYIPDVECVVYIFATEANDSEWKKIWMGPGGKG
jgi:uncharacterized protein YbaR (Trm112 family)